MKLQLQCDNCGKIGDANEISTGYDLRDLCAPCKLAAETADLKERLASKKKWLESTHLAELRRLQNEIENLERQTGSG